MKKTIIIGTIMLMLLVASAMANVMPHPVYGKITSDSYAIQGLDVEVTNINTGDSQITETNKDGFYQADLGNFNSINGLPPYWDGNTIKVTLVNCEIKDECSITRVISGGGDEITFDIAKENIPNDATIVKVQCWDGSAATSVSDCPTKFVCWDNSEVTDEANCPEKDNTSLALSILSGIIAIALAIIGKFKWGKGFVGLANYYKRLGDEAKARGDNAVAEKNYIRAAKMVSTAISRAKDGTYY